MYFICSLQVFSQGYPRGAILDADLYNSLPRKAEQLTRSFLSLPRSASLKHYAPAPGHQGPYGTCVAWATAYAAQTIAESAALDRHDRILASNNAFSPAFVYRSISRDPTCQQGTAIFYALDVAKKQGIPRMQEFERRLKFPDITLSLFSNIRRFPIAGYATLYGSPRGQAADEMSRVRMVKKSLSQGKPVIIGMNCPSSFDTAQGVWTPKESPYVMYGGHAMCVVGYDDDKYGGAFEILNSWGEYWGNDGYIWIDYKTFGRFADEAYELIDDLASYRNATEYSGFVVIERYGIYESVMK
ncbi:C1 family peptidase, partial [Treponema sp. OttesenSCG-928-L16]|nr:C1 family peptidase [Treponema sp. OttesenSCG-928-L16]